VTAANAESELWLPTLGNRVLDVLNWRYSDMSGMHGEARLRVWDTPDGGFFAVVTERGRGMSVTNATDGIWKRLTAMYGRPLGLAELWPEGQSGPAHLDLALPELRKWVRLWPAGDENPMSGLLAAWWAVHAGDVLAP
jgi:hypothetical protein